MWLTPPRPILRAAVFLLCALAVAYPLRVFFESADYSLSLKLLWVALCALGAVRPEWGAYTMLAVPLMPVWPSLSPHVPHGIVHLAVLSQALPLGLRVAAGRPTRDIDAPGWAWTLFVTVAAASALVTFAAYQVSFATSAEFFGEVHLLLDDYVARRPGPGLGNMFLAASAFADGWLAYLVVRESIPASRRTWPLVGFAGVAVAVAVVGITQVETRWGLQDMWFTNDPAIVRVNATFTDPNALAAYLALTLPVVVALVLSASVVGERVFWSIASTLVFIALIRTAGRVGYFGALVAVMALFAGGLLLGLDRADPWRVIRVGARRAAIWGFAVLVSATILLTFVGTLRDVRHNDQHNYVNTVLYTLNLRLPLNERLKGRVDIWRTVGLMVVERPLFGSGVGTIYTRFPSFNEVIGAFQPGTRLSAHNTFLNVTAETGLLGLLAWLAVLATVGAAAIRGLATETDRAQAWLRVGLAAGLLGYAVTMISGDRTILREDLATFAVAGALATLFASTRTSATNARIRRIALLAIGAVALSVPLRAVAERRDVRLEKVAWGFHGYEELEGVGFRWTTERGVFHVPVGASRLTFAVRSLAPFSQQIEVRVNGRLADRLSLENHAWRALTYLLPEDASGARYHRVELRVSPVWEVPGDERTRGVMVGEWRY